MLRVEYRRHPLAGVSEITELPDGLTVQGIVETVSEGVAFDVELLRFDGEGLPRRAPVRPEYFARVRPTPGTVVQVRPRVHAGAVPMLATWLANTTGMSLIASQIVTGLALSAVSFLAQRLIMGAQANPADRAADKQNPTINGLQNSMATRGQPLPLVLGRVRMAPVRVATGYSDLVGQRVSRRERMAFGPGPLVLESLKIGETPIHEFSGEIQLRNFDKALTNAAYPETKQGWKFKFLDDADVMTLYADTIYEDADGAQLNTGVGVTRETPANTIAANVQIYFAGLVKINADNEQVARHRTISYYVEDANDPGGAWAFKRSYTGKTTATLRFGERIDFPYPASWSITVTRESVDDDSTNVYDDSFLDAIQSEIEGSMPSPSGVAEIAIRVTATDQLSGTLDPVNAVVNQMAPVWTGTGFGDIDPEPVRHPADIYIHLLRADYRRKGLTEEQIDLDGIKAWKDTWPNWRCDMTLAADKQLGDLVREVLATGLATPTQIDGKHTVIYDRSDTPAVQVFTPRNTADYTYTQAAPPEVHAFRLVFSSEKAGWADDEMTTYANAYDEGSATEIVLIEAPGLVLAEDDDPTRLAQWAYYHLAQAKTRTTTVSFTTDLEHLVCNRGDPVYFVSDALRNMYSSGRLSEVTHASGDLVSFRLDDAPEDLEGVTAHVMLRSSGGKLQYVTATNTGGTWAVSPGSGVRVSPAGSFSDDAVRVGDLASVYEAAAQEPQKWLVTEIAPEFGERARVTLTEATNVPLDDMSRPLPEYDPKILAQNVVLNATYAIEYDDGAMYVELRWFTGDQTARLPFRVTLTDSSGATIGRTRTTQLSARFRVQSAYPDSLTARIQGQQVAGRWGEIFTLDFSTAEQFGRPDTTANFQSQVMGDALHLTWDAPASNVLRHQIRYSGDTEGALWGTSVRVVKSAFGEQVTVPAKNGTYLIKPVTLQGAWAAEAATVIVTSVNQSLNAIETVALAPNFDGTLENGLVVQNDALLFASDGVIADWDDLAEVTNIFTYGRESLTAKFQFTDQVSLGALDTVRISVTIDAVGYRPSYTIADWTRLSDVVSLTGASDDEWSITVQVSRRISDGQGGFEWSAWEDLVVGDYRARAFRFRLDLEVTDPNVVIEVNDCVITVDMPDRLEKGHDLVVPTSGLTVTFAPPFRAVTSLVIDAQSLPAGGRSVKSAESGDGFTVNFVDENDAPVAGSMDYVAVGYGWKED